LEPISTAVFERMSKATGGKAYFARSWNDEKKAFAFIQRTWRTFMRSATIPAQPQHRMADHHRQAGWKGPAEVPRADPCRIPPQQVHSAAQNADLEAESVQK